MIEFNSAKDLIYLITDVNSFSFYLTDWETSYLLSIDDEDDILKAAGDAEAWLEDLEKSGNAKKWLESFKKNREKWFENFKKNPEQWLKDFKENPETWLEDLEKNPEEKNKTD